MSGRPLWAFKTARRFKAHKGRTERRQRRQNKCAMSELVGVPGLKRGDVQNLTVSLEHMSPNMLHFWLSKFVCEVANQNGERYPPNSL